MFCQRIVWRVVGIVALVITTAQAAQAMTVLAPDAIVAGKSISSWTANWWRWALQAPSSANPLADTSGAFANLNNAGPVFFIAGSDGSSGSDNRSFTVPTGRPVLLPMINFFDVEPSILDGGQPLDARQNAANVVVANWVSAVDTTSLFASIDGSAVDNPSHYLEVTELFSMGPTQADSVIASLGVTPGDVLDPTKAAGYWLMIDGLTPGSHVLHFGGSSNEFTTDTNCCTNGTFPAFLQETRSPSPLCLNSPLRS